MKRELGVCYYPEHWPENMWAKDAKEMVEAGIVWVRIGEFGWSRIEPERGTFEFGWLDRAIDCLAKAGLRIVLGTPTCTPPRWLVDCYPDMFALDADGRPRGFGSRRHYCFSHTGYIRESIRITEMLGDRYGRDPRIHGWQIDNEYGCHDTVLSYSEAAKLAFRNWLSQRYRTIEDLNAAWGNVFWSMEYASFDQIGLPNLTVTQPNPSHDLAFRRFSSDQVVAYHEAQVEALRARTDAPLIHNYMGRVLDFDHFDVGSSIDIASWDSYPIGFLSDRLEAPEDHKARYLRQGDPDMQAFHHDLYRAVGKDNRWWVMEQQPGPVNWAPHNPAPLPGMVRLWTWEAFAHGAEVVSYFRWRQAPFAQEQMHAGLKRPDNTPAAGLSEVETVAQELTALSDVSLSQSKVALIFDYPSEWSWQVLPQGEGFTYFAVMLDAYRALRRCGLSIDIIASSTTDLSAYQLVLAPGLASIPDALKGALQQTTCLIGPRSDAVTPELTIPTPMGPNIPGLNATVARVESLPPEHGLPAEGEGSVQHWAEDLETGAETIFSYADGRPLVVQSGDTYYLGGWPDTVLWDRIIDHLTHACDLPTQAMPEGVRKRETQMHSFYFNYNAEPVSLDGFELPAAGVHWIERSD